MSEQPLQSRYDSLPFDGQTYDHERDADRLKRQLDAVRWLMLDGLERVPDEVCAGAKAISGEAIDWASASARLRDLRKRKHGGYTIHRRHVGNGLWAYKLDVHTSNVIGKED